MPATSLKSKPTFTRHVAPFAPLALALAMHAVPSSSPNQTALAEPPDGIPDNVTAVACEDNITDFQSCHANYPTGCSKAAGYDAYLNYLKNLTPSAASGVNFLDQSGFDNLNTNTPEDLGEGNNHADYKDQLTTLGEGSQYGVIGYLDYYESTGEESSNCELTGVENVDFHIGIGFDKPQVPANPAKPSKALQQSSVIVEMTPHYRAQYHPNDWTLANLKPALGHKVRIIGQLLIDSEHNKPADNCALKGTAAQANHCWRYSIWELHPVTSFEYCTKDDDSCTQGSDDGWVQLGGQSTASGSASSANSGEVSTEAIGASHKPRSPTRSAAPQSDPASRP